MPGADGGRPPREAALTKLQLGSALSFGAAGTVAASRSTWLSAAAWSGAVAAFLWAWSPAWLSRVRPPAKAASAAAMAVRAGAVVLLLAAPLGLLAWSWVLAPVALAMWAAAAVWLHVPWTAVLAAGSAALAVAVALQAFGQDGASDAVAATAFTLACVACCTAAAAAARRRPPRPVNS